MKKKEMHNTNWYVEFTFWSGMRLGWANQKSEK